MTRLSGQELYKASLSMVSTTYFEMAVSLSIPYTLVTAFSQNVSSGNPAGIYFLDSANAHLLKDDKTLKEIALRYPQPMLAFLVGPKADQQDADTVEFDVRYFTAHGTESPLCGHATLAASKALVERNLVSRDVKNIDFRTGAGVIVRAKALPDGQFEIAMPAAQTTEVQDEDLRGLLAHRLASTLGINPTIKSIRRGGPGFERFVMFEIDEKNNLAGIQVKASELVSYCIHPRLKPLT